MFWTPRRTALRQLIAGESCLHPASVFDPISARIAFDLGFEMGMFAGSVAANVVLGAPDLIVLSATEFADQALRINRASELPLMVDADHGYGNALNVRRTVEILDNAGVAALTIEDTDLPMPYGARRPRLIPLDEGRGKMRAALAGRHDPSLIVAGRTSAMAIGGESEAVTRIKAYQDEGVDAIFLTGVRTRAQLEAAATAASVPLLLGGAGPEINDAQLLAEHGVRVSLVGHQPFAAAVQAVHDTMAALRAGTRPADLTGIADRELMARVTRQADYDADSADFLNV